MLELLVESRIYLLLGMRVAQVPEWPTLTTLTKDKTCCPGVYCLNYIQVTTAWAQSTIITNPDFVWPFRAWLCMCNHVLMLCCQS